MEVTEANELRENHEHAAHDSSMRPVALMMAILAVLVVDHAADQQASVCPAGRSVWIAGYFVRDFCVSFALLTAWLHRATSTEKR